MICARTLIPGTRVSGHENGFHGDAFDKVVFNQCLRTSHQNPAGPMIMEVIIADYDVPWNSVGPHDDKIDDVGREPGKPQTILGRLDRQYFRLTQ